MQAVSKQLADWSHDLYQEGGNIHGANAGQVVLGLFPISVRIRVGRGRQDLLATVACKHYCTLLTWTAQGQMGGVSQDMSGGYA